MPWAKCVSLAAATRLVAHLTPGRAGLAVRSAASSAVVVASALRFALWVLCYGLQLGELQGMVDDAGSEHRRLSH